VMPSDLAVLTVTPATAHTASTVPHTSARDAAGQAGGA
jgi:hypothetical protein